MEKGFSRFILPSEILSGVKNDNDYITQSLIGIAQHCAGTFGFYRLFQLLSRRLKTTDRT